GAVREEVAAAAASLRAARDPLVPFGAPAVPDDDVLAGWNALVDWAGGQADEREAALAAARTAVSTAEADRESAERALRRADRAAADRRRDETAAARAEQEARGAVSTVEARLEQLRSDLRDAPTDAEAARQLARATELESTARAADADLRSAGAGAGAASGAAAEVAREGVVAGEALRSARDPLVPLGAPAALGADLHAAWSTLVDWAEAEMGERRTQSAAAEAATRAARADRDDAERRLSDELAAHELPPSAPATAPSAVAAARERALAVGERIAERRETAARLLADRDTAESAQEVARMLGGLLRSDGFPRWLVASALDALVADASTSLAELSGGQFALTHDHGEFVVIDHADADARRPVKTLSGGETFQASLALALALSAQMSGLAARGAARLDSIFLDAGFGTLDEANLAGGAGTLENLAARGDRMVGVVTHVPALAERVPVRFAVTRDQRTSSVTREDV
ncbi:MAG: SMC family ATPase, partial [Pseudonocardia sp.]|nr:SMC family ATPase [Pseudonocardia sp.]